MDRLRIRREEDGSVAWDASDCLERLLVLRGGVVSERYLEVVVVVVAVTEVLVRVLEHCTHTERQTWR